MIEEKHSIEITIADRKYNFTVGSEDEEIFREALSVLSDQLESYRRKYSIKEDQDALAIAAFQFVVKFLKLQKNDVMTITKELQETNNQLDAYFEANMKENSR